MTNKKIGELNELTARYIADSAILPIEQGLETFKVSIESLSQSFSLRPISFSFGDASPSTIKALPAGATVLRAHIVIQTPFNGVGASLKLGDALIRDRLIATSQVDPYFAADFETNPCVAYTVATQILLTIVPGAGCTQGSGYILLEV